MMTSPLLRAANTGDCSALAILADMATRRLTSHLWSSSLEAGQSPLEAGRNAILTRVDQTAHYSNWRVVTVDGSVVGGANSYIQPSVAKALSDPDAPPTLRPLNELKAEIEGSWYVAAIATFEEARGFGIGSILLNDAKDAATKAGCSQLTLMVGSFNAGARDLYERRGFRAQACRPFVPFRESDPAGEWILMAMDL